MLPVISRFFGIIIMMYGNNHSPPHFHAKYEIHEAIICITNGIIKFSKRALKLVLEWLELHKKNYEKLE